MKSTWELDERLPMYEEEIALVDKECREAAGNIVSTIKVPVILIVRARWSDVCAASSLASSWRLAWQ
jgi:hypothetical protein